MRTKLSLLTIGLMALLVAGLVSCEKDPDSNDPNGDGIRLKKIKFTETEVGEGTSTHTITLTYNDDNLLEKIIGENGVYEKITYNADKKPSKWEHYSNNQLQSTTTYQWNGNEVTIMMDDEANLTVIATLNSNGELTSYEGYELVSTSWVKTYYYTYEWINGNLTKLEQFSTEFYNKGERGRITNGNQREKNKATKEGALSSTEFVKVGQLTHTYDNKKNPFYGFKFLMLSDVPTEPCKNNPTSYTSTEYFANGTSDSDTRSYTWEYNTDGYPTKATSAFEGNTEIREYEYESY